MKVLVVDDHALFREALHGVLTELRPDATVLDASDCSQAMRLASEHADLELILLDLGLPDGDGFVMLRELRARYPAIAIVVLSALKDRDSVARALGLGALGFIPKSATRRVTLGALQLVFAGGIFIPPEILAEADASPPDMAAKAAAPASKWVSPSDLRLTDRQLQVVALMMRGMSNKAICRKLNLAEATVKNHITAILKALKVSNRTEAVVAVGELGWQLPPIQA
jgi:DNA-binding NarL/FixJ family response regulator